MFDKVTIFGVGAIGGWLGVRLSQAGCAVSAVARGATLDALRDQGLRLREGPADAPVEHRVRLRAEADPSVLGVQDLVVVSVKAPALPQVAAAIAPLMGPQTVVLSAMNGVPWWFTAGLAGPLAGAALDAVDPGGAIARAIPPAQVVGGVVHASCSTEAPGVVRHHMGRGLIIGEAIPAGVGRPAAAGDPARRDRVAALAGLLARAGLEVTASPFVQRDAWYKLWGNMTINPVCALTGATTDRVLADDLVRGFISAVMLEAREIGARIGIPIEQMPEDRHAVTAKLGAFRPSMLQDVDAGRAVELDALVAVVRELGVRTGVPTPHLDALLGLARLHARVRGLY